MTQGMRDDDRIRLKLMQALLDEGTWSQKTTEAVCELVALAGEGAATEEELRAVARLSTAEREVALARNAVADVIAGVIPKIRARLVS